MAARSITEPDTWLRPTIHPHFLFAKKQDKYQPPSCDVCGEYKGTQLHNTLQCPECLWNVCANCLTPKQLTEICKLPPNLLPRKIINGAYENSLLGFAFSMKELRGVDEKLLPPPTRGGVALWKEELKILNPMYPLTDEEVPLFSFLKTRAKLLDNMDSLKELEKKVKGVKKAIIEDQVKIMEHGKDLPPGLRDVLTSGLGIN